MRVQNAWVFRKKSENQFYSVAVQIKLLLDMPEKVTLG